MVFIDHRIGCMKENMHLQNSIIPKQILRMSALDKVYTKIFRRTLNNAFKICAP